MQEFLTEPASPLYPEEKYPLSQNEKEDFMEKFRNIWKEIFLKYSDTESKLGIININHQNLDGLYSESEGCIYNFISGRSLSYLSRSLMAYIQLGLYNHNILHKCIDGLVGAGSCQFSEEQGKRYRETL